MRIAPIPMDTDPDTWRRLVENMRILSPGQKAARVGELSAAVRTAARVGIRLRHPEATPEQERMYLAALLFGDDLVRRAFGWDPVLRGR
jgi:hypothetical protein